MQLRFGREERERAAGALRPTSDRARERLERFVREGGAVVTTGQQAGLFTGPLYTIYKALTVARLAEALEKELGIVVLPVFWIASEDHDWAEVNHAFLLDGSGDAVRLQLHSQDDRALPMSARPLGGDVIRILDEMSNLMRGHGFTADVLTRIRDAYRPERTVAAAFSALMGELLAPFDLLLTDAADPRLKEASAPVLRHALEHAERHAEVLEERSARLLAAGYHAQVAVLEGATNVFFHGAGERERIDRRPGGFALHNSKRTFDPAELLASLDADPRHFSPSVLLRPVVESAVFPTLAYVGGPGEISYFAQLNALFPEFGIEPPVVFPRFSVTLVEPSVQRLLAQLRLSEADLARPRHELAIRAARDAMPAEVRAGLEELAASLADGYRRLIEQVSRIDPTLVGALGSLRNESLARVGESERKIVRSLKEKEAATLAQIDRVRVHLRPEGQPQERVLNVVPFLACYGPGLLRRILDEMSVSWTESEVPEARAAPDARR